MPFDDQISVRQNIGDPGGNGGGQGGLTRGGSLSIERGGRGNVGEIGEFTGSGQCAGE